MNGQRLRVKRQRKVELELRRGYERTAELAFRMAPKEVNTGFLSGLLYTVSALHVAGAFNLLINATQDLTCSACHSDDASMDCREACLTCTLSHACASMSQEESPPHAWVHKSISERWDMVAGGICSAAAAEHDQLLHPGRQAES